MVADILIVADQSDLNVYKSADKDDMKNGAKAACCGPGSAKKSPCYSADDAVGKDVNFNEWAGKHSFGESMRRGHDAYICIRLVQDIRHQTGRRECLSSRLDEFTSEKRGRIRFGWDFPGA